MIDPFEEQRQRLEQLLADRATGVLAREDLPELHALLEKFSDLTPDAFDQAAAAMDLAFQSARDSSADPLPRELQQQILAAAPQFLTTAGGDPTDSAGTDLNSFNGTAGHGGARLQSFNGHPGTNATNLQKGRRGGWFGMVAASGWLAAAAVLVLAIVLQREPATEASRVLSMAEQREALLSRKGTLQLDWEAGKHPFAEPVSGDVVWNQASQSGFMTFQGLPVNDPTLEQYQLWIIDPSRDDEPIDGGVFDVDRQGRVIIPIDNKLPTIDPQGFAVTIEKPGGVVVSTQERLPLLALVD